MIKRILISSLRKKKNAHYIKRSKDKNGRRILRRNKTSQKTVKHLLSTERKVCQPRILYRAGIPFSNEEGMKTLQV